MKPRWWQPNFIHCTSNPQQNTRFTVMAMRKLPWNTPCCTHCRTAANLMGEPSGAPLTDCVPQSSSTLQTAGCTKRRHGSLPPSRKPGSPPLQPSMAKPVSNKLVTQSPFVVFFGNEPSAQAFKLHIL